MKVYCFKCSALNEESRKISFRATCSKCGSDLHVCKNCRFYSPGKPNDCLVPGTEYVRDRDASNLCEDFDPLASPPSISNDSALEKAKKLFGEELPKKKNPFSTEDF